MMSDLFFSACFRFRLYSLHFTLHAFYGPRATSINTMMT